MAAATRNLRYRQSGATYGNLAYDLERELRERQLSHAGEYVRPREQAAPAPKVRSVTDVQVRPRQHISFLAVLSFAALAAMAVMTLMCYVELTGLSDEVVTLRSQLTTLQTQNVTLVAQHERMFDLATVKEAAEAAGMAKPSSGQIYYMDLNGGDSAVVYQKVETSLLERVITSLNHGVYAVVEYLD